MSEYKTQAKGTLWNSNALADWRSGGCVYNEPPHLNIQIAIALNTYNDQGAHCDLLCACGFGGVGKVTSETPGSREACQLSGSGEHKDELGIGRNFLQIGLYGGDYDDTQLWWGMYERIYL